jgi:Fanconi anemia group I protein
MSEKMDGNNYASHVISRLSSSSWHPSCIIHIVTLCKDVPLSQKELKCLIERLLREMKSLPVQELPPLTYQLFLLSSKGHRSFILRGIIELFDHLNNNIITMSTTDDGGEKEDEVMEVGTSRDELLRNEGTVLFHLDFALKQNQDLLKEFLKSLKVTQSIFNPSLYTPFTLSLALSLTKVLRYEDIIIDSLKAIIIRCYKENELVAHSKWLQAISQYRAVPDINKMFSDIVNSSVFGWDLVMKGLINLSLSILDSCCTPKVNSSLFSSNPINNSYHLAANILILSYKSQSMVRREVISQLVNRTLCNSATYVSHYISILAEIIRFSPHIAVEEGSQIKDVFEYMMYVPSKSAIALIRAVLPLVQFKASFRDSLLLTLRKFLFSREVGCRMIAVGGYLLLLKNFKVLDAVTTQEEVYQYFSQSQTYAEHHLSCDSDRMTSNEAFCLEILGTIRRGLSQQDEVKIVLYEGLMDAFEYNIKMAGPIMEFLLNQFNKYYQSDEGVSPPVKLSPCVSNSGCGFIRAEPLPKLIHCIQHCVKLSSKWVEKGVEPIECMDNVSSMLASLRCRMLNCDLNDFELDKSHDRSCDRSLLNKSHDTSHDVSFSLAADSRNYIIAQIIMELYEVLLDYTFTADHINDASCDVTLKLFAKYHQVVDSLVSDNIKSFKINSLLPMATLSSWMKLLFSDVVPSHQVPLGALRGSSKFVRYVIGTTLVKIKEIPTALLPWKQGTKHDSDVRLQYYDHLLLMGKIMLDQLINGITLQFNGKKEKVLWVWFVGFVIVVGEGRALTVSGSVL